MRILKNILFLFLTGLTLHAFSADPFFPGRRGDLSNKRVRNFRTRITIAPLINFYKINKNHATTPSQKMSGLISVKEEVRLNQSHNMFLSLGAEYMIHGMNFNSYYFRPDTIRLYNGEMDYAYSLSIHELDFPLQLRISFNREKNAQYSPYMAMAYHLRVLLQGDLKVKQDGNVIEKKPEKITFRNPLLNEKCNLDIDPSLDLFAEIEKLKIEKNAVVIAHYYQEPDIQDVADYIGDSLGLSQQAAKTDADIIVFAGVHFMAETAKILSPHKKVLLPDLKAGCSLADACPADLFSRFKMHHPDHVVITYINCSAEIKALSDIICTSSNAQKIIESVPIGKKIIFAPDKNLGKYLIRKTGRDMLLWNGACMVHEIFSIEKLWKLKSRHPHAKVIAHPECETHVLQLTDYIASTTGLLKFTKSDPVTEFIVVTESGIIHQMQKESPEKVVYSCTCR